MKIKQLQSGCFRIQVIGWLFLSLLIFSSFSLLNEPEKLKMKIAKTYSKATGEQCSVFEREVVGSSSIANYIVMQDTIVCGYASVRKAKGCKIGGCSLTENHAESNSYEHFYYLILYNTKVEILLVKVLAYEPEYGYEISNKQWLSQFKGYCSGNIEYGVDIDAISGATTSAFSITADIVQSNEELINFYTKN